ncbi:MAG: DUF6458 family protein [Actinomycetota bacterium]|nr:DUF6458 family protein [Actinomycetota bacterium]
MGIGASIFLIALGAILTFALDFDISGIDIRTIGIILMIAGVLGAILTATVFGRRRSTTYVDDAPVRRERVIERDRDVY